MFAAGHLSGGASVLKRMKLGAAAVDPGIVMIGGAGTSLGVIPSTTTSFDNAYGLAIDEGVYDATPTATTEGLVTVDVRPDLIIRALMTNGGTEGTALATLIQDTASTTVITAGEVSTADKDGGIVWCVTGANVGQSRGITAWNSAADITVTVAFPNSAAVGDTFHHISYNYAGTGAAGADGPFWLTTTALFTQADSNAAAAAGGVISVVDLELQGASNSYVLFVLRDHVHNSAAGAS